MNRSLYTQAEAEGRFGWKGLEYQYYEVFEENGRFQTFGFDDLTLLPAIERKAKEEFKAYAARS